MGMQAGRDIMRRAGCSAESGTVLTGGVLRDRPHRQVLRLECGEWRWETGSGRSALGSGVLDLFFGTVTYRGNGALIHSTLPQ